MLNMKYFESPLATELKTKRQEARAKDKITYDCQFAQVVDSHVPCSKMGTRGIRGKGMLLTSVLAGKSNMICKECPEYQCTGEGED